MPLYGLRISEMLGLSWRNVDLDARELRVVEQLHLRAWRKFTTVLEMAPVKSKEAGQGGTLPRAEISWRYARGKSGAQKALCRSSGTPY